MTNESDSNLQVTHLYESLLLKHGDSFKSLNWGSKKSQNERFKILAEVGIEKGESLLDVGCGLADFYAWLQSNLPGVLYTGIDITSGMINQAVKKFPDVELILGNIFEESSVRSSYDYTVASGIFTYMQNDPELTMQKLISRMFYLSNFAVAFNALSLWFPNKEIGEFYADPCRTLEFCRSLTPWVTLRHDYHPRDFTIYMYKQRNL